MSHPLFDSTPAETSRDELFTCEQSFLQSPTQTRIILDEPNGKRSPLVTINYADTMRSPQLQPLSISQARTYISPNKSQTGSPLLKAPMNMIGKKTSPQKTPPPRRSRKRWSEMEKPDPATLLQGSGPLSPTYEHIIPSPSTSHHTPPSPLQSPLMKYEEAHVWDGAEDTWQEDGDGDGDGDDGEDDGEEPFQAMGDIEDILEQDELEFDRNDVSQQATPRGSTQHSPRMDIIINQPSAHKTPTNKQTTPHDSSLLVTPALGTPSTRASRASPRTASSTDLSSPLSFSDLIPDPRMPTRHIGWDEHVSQMKSPTEYFATRSQPLGSIDGQATTPPQFGIAPRTPGVNPLQTPISILKTPGLPDSIRSHHTPSTSASASSRTPLAPIHARTQPVTMAPLTSPSPIRASTYRTSPSPSPLSSLSPSRVSVLGAGDVSLDAIDYRDTQQTPIKSIGRVSPSPSPSPSPSRHAARPLSATPSSSGHTPTGTPHPLSSSIPLRTRSPRPTSTATPTPQQARITLAELQARVSAWLNDDRIKLKHPVEPSGAHLVKQQDISVLASSRLYSLHRFIHFTIDPTRIPAPSAPQHHAHSHAQHVNTVITAAVDTYMSQAYTPHNFPRVYKLCQSHDNAHVFTLLLIFDDTSRESRPSLGLTPYQTSPLPTATYIPSTKWHADWIRYMSFYCASHDFVELRPPH